MTDFTARRAMRPRIAGLIGIGLLAIATLSWPAAVLAEPAGDPARGARLFLQCRACHAVAPDAPAGVGPDLWGVVGSRAGARPGFHYSASLAGSGVVWTPGALDRWLTRPTDVAPGTTMAFQGVPSAQSRADIIAYLASLARPDAAAR